MYKNNKNYVRTENKETNEFGGLQQGGIKSGVIQHRNL